jgi:F420-0:gamma-glutamyl ligase
MDLRIPGEAGVVLISLKTPLILPSDDIRGIAVSAVEGIVEDGDIICVTESVLARSQNRYITCDELAQALISQLKLCGGDRLAVISPIVSRNRFALILRAIAKATRGGYVVVQLSIPADEVGNQVLDEDFTTKRLRFKGIFNSLQQIRGNTPHMNVLIRELLAALKLQEIGYDISAIRKITGQGVGDLTLQAPDGRSMIAEVSFENLSKTSRRALSIKNDVQSDGTLAITVDLERQRVTIVDAEAYLASGMEKSLIAELSYSTQVGIYQDPDCIYSEEVQNRRFVHPITKMDYPGMYLDLIQQENANGEILFTNNPLKVFDAGVVDGVIIGAVHKRNQIKDLFGSFGTKTPVLTIQGLGPGPWGVIGSNASDLEKGILKLLPDNADVAADSIKESVKQDTGREVEVLIFGDGAYKDPDTGIYELADPHPCIGCSSGLRSAALRTGTKLKLQVETWFRQGYSREQMAHLLQNKESNISRETLGTTPRSVTSILGTLADLAAGSADAGTPIVLVRNFVY